MRNIIEHKILPRVEKPIRYQGNELNSIHKNWEKCNIKMAFAFPDIYEIGMSHLGLQILYGVVNNIDDMVMERVFSPWVDMEKYLREYDLPLFSLESYRPIRDFDFLGVTLQYEMSYSNILNIFDLAKIPLLAKERDGNYPIVFAGGPCAYNSEPLVDFFDLFMLGDGEESMPELLNLAKEFKNDSGIIDKESFLKEASKLEGIYIPKYYDIEYKESGKIKSIEPNEENASNKIRRRVVKDLDKAYYPTKPIVPYMDVVHNRAMLEVLRGCTHGCRFCHAGLVYRPVRERKPETLYKLAKEILKNTGHNEISLTSLSTADYTCLEPVMKDLINAYGDKEVGISLPSLRIDEFSIQLAKEIQKVRKTGLTFAPEAGTQRLRDVINKGVTEEDLIDVVTAAFSEGWSTIKLYFMIGLPTETIEDIKGIADLAKKVLLIGKGILKERNSKQNLKITVSIANFVPKAHTPFQWFPQNTMDVLKEKQKYLRGLLKDRHIVYNYHDAKLSFLEAVLAKGDRKLGQVLKKAWEKGCKFDSWQDYFKYDLWMEAFEECSIDPNFYAYGDLIYDDMLPWEHIDIGLNKKFLIRELEKAYEEDLTSDCRYDKCTGCGICNNLETKLILQKRRN